MLSRGRGRSVGTRRLPPARALACAGALVVVLVASGWPATTPAGAQVVDVPVEAPAEASPDAPPDAPAEVPPAPPLPPLAGPEAEYREVLAAEAEARRSLSEAEERARRLSAEVTELDAELATGEAELAVVSAALAEADARNAAVQAEVSGAADRLAREQQRLRDQAVVAYMGGNARATPTLVRALNAAPSSNDLAKSIVYASVVVGDRQQLVAQVRELRDQAAGLEAEAEAARLEAADAHALVAERVAAVQDRRARRAAAHRGAVAAATHAAELAAHLEVQRQEHERRYAQMATESDSIASLLQARQRRQEPATSTYGTLGSPVPGSPVVSGFGMRLHPILGIYRMHNGLDLDAPHGAPVLASADGEVVVASEQGGYGLTVVIDHGGQLATLSSHLSAVHVAVGDVVAAGEVIGAVGSTGLSTGPHCHWEVRVLGRAVDGTPYLRAES